MALTVEVAGRYDYRVTVTVVKLTTTASNQEGQTFGTLEKGGAVARRCFGGSKRQQLNAVQH